MSESKISILVIEAKEEIPGRRMGPATERFATRVVEVSTETLKNSIREVSAQVNELAENMTSEQNRARLDQITVGLEVSANGSVSWLAGIGAGVNGTMSLTFKIMDQDG